MLGVVGRGGPGNGGRCPGRGAPGAPGRAPAAGAAGRAPVVAVGSGPFTMRGCETCGRLAGAKGRVGCGILPGSSMRRRIVGGTKRPVAVDAAAGVDGGSSATGAGDSSTGAATTTVGSGGGAGGSTGTGGGGSGAGGGATSTSGGAES